MKDPVNPTSEELEAWARTPGALFPMEDWELLIAEDDNADLFLRLANDPTVANRDSVLGFLYIYVGAIVRGYRAAERLTKVRDLVAQAETSALDDVRTWARRAAEVLANSATPPPHDVDRETYELWFEWGWRGRRDLNVSGR